MSTPTSIHMYAPMITFDNTKSMHISMRPYATAASMSAPMHNLQHEVDVRTRYCTYVFLPILHASTSMSTHTTTPTSWKNLCMSTPVSMHIYAYIRTHVYPCSRRKKKSTPIHMSAPMLTLNNTKSMHISTRPYATVASMSAPMHNLQHEVDVRTRQHTYVFLPILHTSTSISMHAYKITHRLSPTYTPAIQNQCSTLAKFCPLHLNSTMLRRHNIQR